MQIYQLDHLVLTVRDISVTLDFYTRVLGMEKIVFGDNRHALVFGNQKINLHQLGNEFEPKAQYVQSGSADLCLIMKQPVSEAITHLQQQGVSLVDGPVRRTGATGSITSIYIYDPDGNLIELSNY